MRKTYLIRYLFLTIVAGLALYCAGKAQATVTARMIPHAPDWANSQAVLISDISSPNVSDRPYIAASPNGNKLIVVYNRQMSASITDHDPYYSRSNNSGQSWASPKPIHTSLGDINNSLEVNVVIDGNGAGHAVWVEADTTIAYSSESDWGNNNPFIVGEALVEVSSPQIVASGSNTLDIIWAATDFGQTQIWHRRSLNGGISWTAGGPISNSTTSASTPRLAIDNSGNLNVVWEEETGVSLPSYVAYVKGTPTGNTLNWSNPRRIGNMTADLIGRVPKRPNIIADGNRLLVSFTAFKDNDLPQKDSQWVHYVTCPSSCQSLQNWSEDNNLSGALLSVNANSPKYIVADLFNVRGCIHAYYHGINEDQLENNERIFGTNNCDAWATVGRDVVTAATSQSLHVSVAATDDWVHMVYEQTGNQSQNTTRQIYYRRGLPPPFTVVLPVVRRAN